MIGELLAAVVQDEVSATVGPPVSAEANVAMPVAPAMRAIEVAMAANRMRVAVINVLITANAYNPGSLRRSAHRAGCDARIHGHPLSETAAMHLFN
jgi:hypothetical protein